MTVEAMPLLRPPSAMVGEIEGGYGAQLLYFTELMGVAFGLRPASLGLTKHLRNPEPLLYHHGLLTANPITNR